MDKQIANPTCSCGREPVIYLCTVKECPNHDTQREYCQKCVIDFEKHVHKPEEIAMFKLISDIENRWTALDASYDAIMQLAREKCKPIKNLLTFLEEISRESQSLMPSKPIEADYDLLTKNSKDIQVHLAALTELVKEKNQEKLSNFDKSYAALKDAIPKFDYLKTLSELDVFKAYKAAI